MTEQEFDKLEWQFNSHINADKKVFWLSHSIEEYELKDEDYDYLKWENEPVEVFLNLEN